MTDTPKPPAPRKMRAGPNAGQASGASAPPTPPSEARPREQPTEAAAPASRPDPGTGTPPARPEPKKKQQPGGGKGGGGGRKQNAPPRVVEVAPIAKPARMRKRHWAVLFSFVIFVVMPVAAAGYYLWTRATDQYASTVGFTIRQEEGGAAAGLIGGVAAQLTGGGGQSDTDILYEFIQSQNLVAAIDDRFDLRRLYSAPWEMDPVFALPPDATLEDLAEYWQRIVRISYDGGSQLIELEVRAFEPDTAQAIGQEILAQSQTLINQLNAQARADTIRYAEADLVEAQTRLREARSALILFRTRTQLVDPETDLQGRMGVVNTLQQQLAEALIDLDLLAQSTNDSDPRVIQARRRIEVIRARIEAERANVASGANATSGEDYPTLLAEYESLLADREFAEETWRASLTALDLARANAARQSRYLATYIAPTLPQSPLYPQRWMLLGLTGLFSLLTWAIMALIYYSIRDSR